jgi:hypothetical protein
MRERWRARQDALFTLSVDVIAKSLLTFAFERESLIASLEFAQ